jgi:hypothetical protein
VDTRAGAPETVGLKIGEAEVPVTERGEIWMHYSLPAPERTVPAWKILSGRLPPAEMERLFLNRRGLPYKVSDAGGMEDWVG